MVCQFTQYYPDDLEAECSRCGATVFIRPHSRKYAAENGLPIICINCIRKVFKEENFEIAITEETEKEIAYIIDAFTNLGIDWREAVKEHLKRSDEKRA